MAYTEAELLSLGHERVLVLMYLGQQAAGQGVNVIATLGSVATNAANPVQLPSTPAKRVTFSNVSGTTIGVKYAGGGYFPLPTGTTMSFAVQADANELFVFRVDGGAAVQVGYKIENW